MQLAFRAVTASLLALCLCAAAQSHPSASDHNAILQSFFGNVDAAAGTAHWRPEKLPDEFTGELNESEGRARTRIVFDQPFREKAADKRMVVFSTVPDVADSWECHACAPFIGMAILRCSVDTACVTEARNDFVAQTGQKGDPPTLSLMQLGPDHMGLLSTYEYFWDGEGDGVTQLFAVVEGKPQTVLDIRNAQIEVEVEECASPHKRAPAECRSNRYSGICRSAAGRRDADFREMCSSWTGSLRLAPGLDTNGWHDLILTQTVRAAAPGAFRLGTYRTHFMFHDGAYQPERAATDGPPYCFRDSK